MPGVVCGNVNGRGWEVGGVVESKLRWGWRRDRRTASAAMPILRSGGRAYEAVGVDPVVAMRRWVI